MQDTSAPDALRDFQIRYGKYLRSPETVALPDGIPERRSEIYEGLLFNNISGFINSCFPVARSLHSEERWLELRRAFFREWRSPTPLFSKIPFEFVRFLSETLWADKVEPWLPELLHYEWVELDVDLDDSEAVVPESGCVALNPSAHLLAYNWPVHAISADMIPEEPQATFLVVYRNPEMRVRFVELNATTYMLLQFIQENPGKEQAVAEAFVSQIEHPEPGSLIGFALDMLSDLKKQHVLLGAEQ